MKCAGEKFWFRRAVDQHGAVLEEILQKRRDKRAARRLLVALMERHCFAPKRVITDKLRSCGAAKADMAPPSTIGRTRVSTIGPKTVTCRF